MAGVHGAHLPGSTTGATTDASPPDERPRRAPWVGAEPPATQVVAGAVALLLGAAVVEILLRGSLGLIVGLTLVLVAATAALLVPPRDLFTAGVLPPLLLLALLVVMSVVHPDAIAATRLASSASVPQRVIAGFVDLAGALVVAHGLALLLVALRARASRPRLNRAVPRQP